MPNERTRLLQSPATPTRCPVSLQKPAPVSLEEAAQNTTVDTDTTADLTDDTASTALSSMLPPGISTRQLLILTVLMLATMTSSFAVCLFPPFFPKLAEEKGCSATIYGLIIGTNCLTSFIVTPFIGKHLRTMGVRFSLILGMFTGGVCCFLSGFLEFFSPGINFIALAIMIRVVHATGNAMVITATFTFTAIEFQNSVGKVFSMTRFFMNIAQLFGPSVGGIFLGWGGFHLPFAVMGVIQVIMAIWSIYILPECATRPSESQSNGKGGRRLMKKVTVSNMLRIPRIWISFLTFIVATACNGFLSINLEPKVLRNFDLSPVYVGLLFGLKDGANSFASPLWGIVCDHYRKTSVKPFIISSALLAFTSFFLLGSCNVFGFHIKLSLPLVVVALSLNGIGIGGEQVAGIVDALHEAVNAGYPDDPNMHGLIAGLWSSLSGAGRFVSRAGSGYLVDTMGFDKTAAVASGLQALVVIITFVYMIFYECRLKKTRSVRWEDVTIIENEAGDEDEVFFTETHSPSESIMERSVHIEVPCGARKGSSAANTPRHVTRSLPQNIVKSGKLLGVSKQREVASSSLNAQINESIMRSLS